MQNKTTLKRILQGCKNTLMILGFSIWCMNLNAQTISTAGGSNYLGNLSIGNVNPLNVSFVIQNTTGTAIALTSVSTQMGPFTGTSVAGDASVTKLFVSSTSLSGAYDYSTAAWTQIGSGNAVVPATLSVEPVITGITYSIPAGAQLRFILELSKGLRISSTLAGDPMPTPNVFSAGGFNLQLGNFQIAGLNVGFGGVAPTAPAANTPVFFGGSVTLSPAIACTGTPAPGNTVSTASSVCPATPFTLSVSSPAVPGTTGLTYQWQSSATGVAGSFANIAGAQSATYTTTMSASTFYQLLVSCGANVGTSTPVQVTVNAPSTCYCAAGASNTTFEKISKVTLNTINNATSSTAGYEDFTAISTSLTPGQPYPLSVSVSQPFAPDQVIVWIDYNQNGVFTDPGETVYTSPAGYPVVAPATVTGSLVVPFTALPGTTRMRVRLHDTSIGANATSCGNSTYGQVEDYTVNILPVVPCTGTPTPGNTISTVPTVCGGTNFTLSLQNFTSGSGVTYQWQSSATGAAGSFTNITGATSVTYTTTQTTANYYQAVVTCGANAGTSTAIQVLSTAFTGCYCTPPASNCNLDDRISNVTFGSTLNNNSACSSNGYANYMSTVPATNIIIGALNPMRVTVGPGGTEYVGVWIDYNHNAVYETSEFTLLGNGNGVTIAGNINIPATALLGQTGMRVRVRYNTTLTGANACLSYAFGETEDYLVNIAPCVTSTVTTQPPATKTIACSGTGTITATIAGSLNQYQWQVLVTGTGAVWTDLVNNATYSGVTTNILTITNALPTINGYQYRVRYVGGCTSPSVTTASTLTVGALEPTVSNTLPINRCSTDAPTTISIATPVGLASLSATASGALNTNIPDNNDQNIDQNTNFISNNIVVNNIPAGSTITGFNVKLNITHSWVGDLIFVLKAPNGKTINLAYALSGTGGVAASTGFTNTVISSTGTALLSSGTNPYTSTFRLDNAGPSTAGFTPTGPLGFNPNTILLADMYQGNGTWTLALYDYYKDDQTTNFLKDWELNITYIGQTTAIFTPATGLFTDAAGTIAYTGQLLNTVYANPTASTTYAATVNTAICGAGTVSIPVNVGSPLSGTSTVANQTGCVGGNVTFSSTAPTGGLNATYQWQISTDAGVTWTNIAGATAANYTLSAVTTSMTGNRYRVVRTVASCTSTLTSSAGTLTVGVIPVVILSANPLTQIYPGQTTTLTAAVSPNAAATYTWFRDGVVVAGATANTLVVNVDGLGVYTVRVNDVNGCSGTSASITIKDAANDILFIYPSPNTGQFQVRYFSELGSTVYPRTVNVYDSKGTRVFTKAYSINSPYTRIDVDLKNHAKGIYSVELTDYNGNRIKTGRVLVL